MIPEVTQSWGWFAFPPSRVKTSYIVGRGVGVMVSEVGMLSPVLNPWNQV